MWMADTSDAKNFVTKNANSQLAMQAIEQAVPVRTGGGYTAVIMVSRSSATYADTVAAPGVNIFVYLIVIKNGNKNILKRDCWWYFILIILSIECKLIRKIRVFLVVIEKYSSSTPLKTVIAVLYTHCSTHMVGTKYRAPEFIRSTRKISNKLILGPS